MTGAIKHSIKSRFIVSLFANITRSGITFATGLLLARWLGPVEFGRMAFLLASFLAVKQLLDMASSSAFFTFLSQRRRSKFFIRLYWRWIAGQFILSLVFIGVLLPDNIIDSIWQGESNSLVLLALIAVFMQQTVWSIASQMAESQRETIKVQYLSVVVVVIHLCVVFALWVFEQLAITFLFVALAIEWALASLLAARLYRTVDENSNAQSKQVDTTKSVWLEFWHYCLPLIPYAWLGFIHDFADRWMLQHWGGAREQAYYAVAQLFSGIALLATVSILRIFWKEIAEAHHNGDSDKVKFLYKKVSRGLYFSAAIIAGGLFAWSSEILELFVGTTYLGGAMTLMLMFFYPVHQTVGQIGGTMLYATGKTYLQVVLGSIFMITSLITAYFMLAPNDAMVPGFGLASQGLAWKMVVLQFIHVNIVSWFIARTFGWKYDWQYQFFGLAIVVSIGWLTKMMVVSLWSLPIIFTLIVSLIFYIIFIVLIIFLLPGLLGFSRDELRSLLFNLKHIFVIKC